MVPMGSKVIKGIARDTLDFILNASKSTHPLEFAGLLQTEKDVIANVILLPGTKSSEMSAVMRLDMAPIGLSTVGSVHSHPIPDTTPSDEDLHMFSRRGNYHMITCYPYDWDSWKCYNRSGTLTKLEILDVEFDIEEESIW